MKYGTDWDDISFKNADAHRVGTGDPALKYLEFLLIPVILNNIKK